MVNEKKIQIDENKTIKIPHYIQNIALNEIEILLNNAGKSLVDFKCFPKLTQIKNNTLINIARKYDTNILKQKVKENIIKFNSKQLNAFEEIMDRINHKSSKHNLFFISGAGGCGKTFLENTILDHVRSQGNIAIAMASSAIAAILLHDGHTAHSVLKIPIQANSTSVCNFTNKTQLADLIKAGSVFIWDEAPMMSKFVYDTVDRSFRDVMKNVNPDLEHIPFGGKIIIFSGDFRQFLPIVRYANRSTTVHNCMTRCDFWNTHVQQIVLTENMRLNRFDDETAKMQKEFGDYLLRIGDGVEEKIQENSDLIQLRDDLCIKEFKKQNLIDQIYPNFSSNYTNEQYLQLRSIICTLNINVDYVNKKILKMIPEKKHTLLSIDSHVKDEQVHYHPVEFMNKVNISSIPPHELKLKKMRPSYYCEILMLAMDFVMALD